MMVDNMKKQMYKKMYGGSMAYAHGGKVTKNKADISAMEKACSSKAGKNKSVSY